MRLSQGELRLAHLHAIRVEQGSGPFALEFRNGLLCKPGNSAEPEAGDEKVT